MFKGIHYKTGKPIQVWVQDGGIARIDNLDENDCSSLPIIAPGLVDLQINGYYGIDLNTLPLTGQDIEDIAEKLWSQGITTFYPTVITNSNEALEKIVSIIASACEENDRLNSCIKGIHLEGPFISNENGPRGAHQLEYVQPSDWTLLERWQDAAKGRIKIITLSPEWPASFEFIQKCKSSGIVVSIGHTAASSEQIKEAVEAGATLSTHLGNGAHLSLPRHPNYIWEQLAQDSLWTSCIADGFHLPDSFLKVIFKVKEHHAVLVSDAVSLSGKEPGRYRTHIGGDVILTAEGKLHLADNPNLLAGSVQMLISGVKNLVQKGICSFSDAWEAASIRPSKLMNLPTNGGLCVNGVADFILLKDDGMNYKILQTVKHGKIVYTSKDLNP
ncbi:N-acetylglucosamine-6-phosphate deacetylase [Bacillus timonensis]|uniref:N-acetylglucosamine-6-phosphate deacetylase n=1 Tax=Bacillus timonensis TaxID=1033734 RepID=UPI00028978FD|nr:amidohydrolase family protein [Bacillus timonensis]